MECYLGMCVSEHAEEEISGAILLAAGHSLGDMVQRLVAGDGKDLVGAEVEVEPLQVRLVRDAILERHAHEASEALQARHDLLHHLERGVLGRDDHGAQAQVRRAVRARCQRLQERRPLRAVRVADVHDVDPHLALERLHHRRVPCHMPKRRPRRSLLEMKSTKQHGCRRSMLFLLRR